MNAVSEPFPPSPKQRHRPLGQTVQIALGMRSSSDVLNLICPQCLNTGPKELVVSDGRSLRARNLQSGRMKLKHEKLG